MTRVLAVSPHLDDAAFSVGGTLSALVDAGHEVTVLTCFTRSVPGPTGFALACQLDKGLGPEVDYMALRRAEDDAAMAVLGVRHVHAELPEAPHRGYASAAELFAGVRADDGVGRDLDQVLAEHEADVWLAPQALGDHVDHVLVRDAVRRRERPTAWWADVPYALRLPSLPEGVTLPRAPRRADACACYASQLGFQFGGEAQMRVALEGVPEVLQADEGVLALLR